MSPQIHEYINVNVEPENRQNALRVFGDFHERFVTAPRVEIEGFEFGPPDILGAVKAIIDTDKNKGIVTLHQLRASHALAGSVIAIASSDGETTTAHVWSVRKLQLRDDIVWRDRSQYVHRRSEPCEARGIFGLERTYYEGGQERRLFAKLIVWENGGCEVYTPEVQGGVNVIPQPKRSSVVEDRVA